MMHYLNHNTERALSVTGGLARTFWRAITTMTPAKYVVCYAQDVITSYYRQQEMTNASYNRQSIISDIHRHEQYWEKETGRTTPTEPHGDEYCGDKECCDTYTSEPAFTFSNDDGTKLYGTADDLGMTTTDPTTKIEWRHTCCKE